MSFKVNMSGVAAKLHSIATNRRLGQVLAEEAASGMDQYVPYRSGDLASSTVVTPFHVEYTMDYSKYPYYGRNMTIQQEHHKNATSEWDKAYAAAHLDELAAVGTAFVRRM